jgi:transposase InsO family protein
MSKKGCSLDNATCEGFHGRLKNEFFYNRDWRDITIKEFFDQLDEYLHWYCEDRVKNSWGARNGGNHKYWKMSLREDPARNVTAML